MTKWQWVFWRTGEYTYSKHHIYNGEITRCGRYPEPYKYTSIVTDPDHRVGKRCKVCDKLAPAPAASRGTTRPRAKEMEMLAATETSTTESKTVLSRALRAQSQISRVRATNAEAQRWIKHHDDHDVKTFAQTWRWMTRTGRLSALAEHNVSQLTAGQFLDLVAGTVARFRRAGRAHHMNGMRDALIEELQSQELFS